MENASRLISDAEIENRFGYHPSTDITKEQHEKIRSIFIDFTKYLRSVVPPGRAMSLSLTNLQQAAMWANFGIAEQAPLELPQGSSADESQPS